jgi:hypothetical protein
VWGTTSLRLPGVVHRAFSTGVAGSDGRWHSGRHAGVVAGPHRPGAPGRVRRLWEASHGALPGVPCRPDRGRTEPGATGAGTTGAAGGARGGSVRGRGARGAPRPQGTGCADARGATGSGAGGGRAGGARDRWRERGRLCREWEWRQGSCPARLVPGAGGSGGVGGSRMPVSLVPVPSAPWAVRARGHDPARRIALAAAGELRRTGTPARVVAVLRQRRAVADQSGLNSRQRLDNLAGALEVPRGRAAAGRRRAGRARRRPDDDGRVLGGGGTGLGGRFRDGNGPYGRVTPKVTREGMARATATGVGRPEAVREMRGANGAEGMLGAAVVAAPPASFEINRN